MDNARNDVYHEVASSQHAPSYIPVSALVCASDVPHGLTTEMTSIARVDPDPDSDPNRDHNPDRGGERDGVLGCGYGCCAVDVGSSPGGWTQCLAAHCSSVISIDSGGYVIGLCVLMQLNLKCDTLDYFTSINLVLFYPIICRMSTL